MYWTEFSRYGILEKLTWTEENCIGKRSCQQETGSHAEIYQLSSAKTYGESICLECLKWNADFTRTGYSATWGIWNVDMEVYDESIVDWAQNKWRVLQMVETEREMMDTLRSRRKRWLGHIRHNSLLRRTLEGTLNTREKLVEDQEQCSWIGYWKRRKTISIMINKRCWQKTDQDDVSEDGRETCHIGRILQHGILKRNRQVF